MIVFAIAHNPQCPRQHSIRRWHHYRTVDCNHRQVGWAPVSVCAFEVIGIWRCDQVRGTRNVEPNGDNNNSSLQVILLLQLEAHYDNHVGAVQVAWRVFSSNFSLPFSFDLVFFCLRASCRTPTSLSFNSLIAASAAANLTSSLLTLPR